MNLIEQKRLDSDRFRDKRSRREIESCQKITIDSLGVKYRDSYAFKHVNLTIQDGCITALVGPSGCGKTSLLNCLNRLTDLIPDCQVTGKILLNSTNILTAKTDVRLLRQRVGMIFQKPNPFPISIRKNFAIPLTEYGIRKRADQDDIIESTLKSVGLWEEVKDRLHFPALSLSGGQQQRLCIARAIALKPEVILFDEPCSALDPIASGVVEDLIASLRGHYTVIIVTHNLFQAKRIADYTVMFWVKNGAGELIESGLTQEIFENPKNNITRAYVSGHKG